MIKSKKMTEIKMNQTYLLMNSKTISKIKSLKKNLHEKGQITGILINILSKINYIQNLRQKAISLHLHLEVAFKVGKGLRLCHQRISKDPSYIIIIVLRPIWP